MAKQGLDYFSLDVTFDTSLEVIIAKSGDKALSSIVRIWQHIYKHNGYYMEYNEDELYMIKRMCNDTTIKELKNVIELMVSKNLFNKEMFDNKKILTSKRLQDNYKEATKRRINAGEPLTYCIHDVNIFKQSKVKESKVNKSKEDIMVETKSKNNYQIVKQTWNNLGLRQIRDLTDKRKKHINARVKDFTEEKFIALIKSIKDSKFLMQQNGKGWFDFDWILNPNNAMKLYEGKYHEELNVEVKDYGKNQLPKDIESDWLDDYIAKL